MRLISSLRFSLILALASGAATAAELTFPTDVVGPYTLRVTSLKEARHLTTLRQQYDFSCGSAALATLLTHHYGRTTTEQQVFIDMFNTGDQAKIRKEGFSLLDMKRYLANHGFQADGFEAPLDALVKVGIPGIALVQRKRLQPFRCGQGRERRPSLAWRSSVRHPRHVARRLRPHCATKGAVCDSQPPGSRSLQP